MKLSTQQNPTYFNDHLEDEQLTGQGNQSSLHKSRFAHRRPPVPVSRITPANPELEMKNKLIVENALLKRQSKPTKPSYELTESSKIPRKSSSAGSAEFLANVGSLKGSGNLSFGNRISQLFWKSKPSKKSSTIIAGRSSPALALYGPDEASNITVTDSFTSTSTNSNSSDSEKSSSNTSGSRTDQNKTSSSVPLINSAMEDDFCSYSYDDCQRYATNMYYNMGEISSFPIRSTTTGSVSLQKLRNNSFPLTNDNNFHHSSTLPLHEVKKNSSVPNSYYNTNFSTFPNPRRHSIATSSAPRLHDATSSTPGLKDRNGYLIPKTESQIDALQSNAVGNVYMNEPLFNSQNSTRGGTGRRQNLYHDQSEMKLKVLNQLDQTGCISTSTLCECDGNNGSIADNVNFEKHSYADGGSGSYTSTLTLAANVNDYVIIEKNEVPLYKRRIPYAQDDCEPYCSFCSAVTTTPSSGSINKSTMDVAIVSCQECFFSQRAESQLKCHLEGLGSPDGQKIDMILQSYDLKDIDNQTTAAEVHRSKVQIVIISNHFLDRLRHEATVRKKLSPINRVLRSKRVIAVLVSLSCEDITECYQSVLARFHEWYVVELKSTSKLEDEFCKKLTEQVVKIYNVELSNTSNFSIFPTKVRKDQPKVVVMFKNVIQPEDTIRIELSRGRQTQIIAGIRTTNPYTAFIRVPDVFCTNRTCLIEITAFVNNQKLGTKLVKYEHQSKQTEDDVIERMSRTLTGFRKVFDEHISQALSRNFRLCEDFSLDPSLELLNDILICREDEFPTVMHLATYYGLDQTVWVLLEEGDGLEQCSVRNDMNETPLDIAQAKGYESSIGQTIKDYQEVTFTWKAFQFVKDLYERHSEEGEKVTHTCEQIELLQMAEADRFGELSEVIQEKLSPSDNITATTTSVNSAEEVKCVTDIIISECQANVNSIYEGDETPTSMTRLNAKNEMQQNYFGLLPAYDIPPPPLLVKPAISATNYYDMPRKTTEDYCIPPNETRALTNFVTNPGRGPILVKRVNTITNDQNGYILVQTSDKQTSSAAKVNGVGSAETNLAKVDDELQSSESTQSYPQVTSFGIGIDTSKKMGTFSPPSSFQKPVNLDASDENLIELLNDFKENVYTMSQLELLFENWKSRSDVQDDLIERQKELKRIRDDYKKIQEELRKNKRTSPLERFMKFFPGGKKKQSNAGLVQIEEQTRKVSGCSDRGSSHSGGSFPDSGLSDPDSEKDKDKSVPVFWKNPHDKRFFTSYVPPNSQSEPHPPVAKDNVCEIIPSPPPVPVKKISTSTAPVTCPSPPVSPLTKKESYPVPSPQLNTSHNKLSKKSSKEKASEIGITPAPPTPPRKGMNQNQAPFNFINYKSKTKEINGISTQAMKREPSISGAEAE